MKPINLVKEIVVRIPDQKGFFARVMTPLAEARVNLRAVNLTGFANDGLVRLHADDHAKALEVLRKNDLVLWEQDVLACEITNEAGSAARIISKLSQANLDIRGLFASTGTGANTTLYVWLHDYQAAMNALK